MIKCNCRHLRKRSLQHNNKWKINAMLMYYIHIFLNTVSAKAVKTMSHVFDKKHLI